MFRHRACLGGSTAFALLFSLAIQVAHKPMNPRGKPGGERFTSSQANFRATLSLAERLRGLNRCS